MNSEANNPINYTLVIVCVKVGGFNFEFSFKMSSNNFHSHRRWTFSFVIWSLTTKNFVETENQFDGKMPLFCHFNWIPNLLFCVLSVNLWSLFLQLHSTTESNESIFYSGVNCGQTGIKCVEILQIHAIGDRKYIFCWLFLSYCIGSDKAITNI